jgi:hypothetical protein
VDFSAGYMRIVVKEDSSVVEVGAASRMVSSQSRADHHDEVRSYPKSETMTEGGLAEGVRYWQFETWVHACRSRFACSDPPNIVHDPRFYAMVRPGPMTKCLGY